MNNKKKQKVADRKYREWLTRKKYPKVWNTTLNTNISKQPNGKEHPKRIPFSGEK